MRGFVIINHEQGGSIEFLCGRLVRPCFAGVGGTVRGKPGHLERAPSVHENYKLRAGWLHRVPLRSPCASGVAVVNDGCYLFDFEVFSVIVCQVSFLLWFVLS